MQSESVSLYFKEGSSDKEYHAQLESHDGGWTVNFQYGRRGSALRADSKTPQPLPYEEAKKIYDKVVREKIGKGYRPLGGTLPAPIGQASEPRKTGLACELLTAIEFKEVAKYILDLDYWLQDKRDGQRRMVEKRANRALLGVNRRGLTVPLPATLHTELTLLDLQTFVLDGEIEEDRLVVFDLLDADGDLRQAPYADRFDRLLLELAFDAIIIVTDRRILDKQIRDTIKQFAQVGATVGAVTEGSQQLRQFIEIGKKIIISTVQKFPFILDEIGTAHRSRKFAIIIDEAHSSQGGKTSAAISEALADPEDTVNDVLEKRMLARKMLTNASYFAFTATPKNKTLEIFGEPHPAEEGRVKHRPFHSYTMKQAIQEGFILDVLRSYTPVHSYYKLVKTVESDPEFDVRRAQKKLRRYVESHDYAIRLKAEIIVDHFHEQVLGLNKVGGQARAMVVTSGIERAIQYFHAVREYLKEQKSRYQAIVAFSGEHEYDGVKVTEASLNGFPSAGIADEIQEDPYRFLICADKFQTGYDEPLLHTMYVDKQLSGIKAVQTLSRLNRAHPQKHDVFVLDFMNDSETITEAFADYYRTTVLSEETDPNKLHDLKTALDGYQVYDPGQVGSLAMLYLGGGDRDKLDPILDACVAVYKEQLDEDGQVDFKGKAKSFVRTYDFLSSILPYTNAEWEKLSIFLNFLVSKLPAPREEDLSKGILEAIDMDSYRAEKKAAMKLTLADENAEIGPVPVSTGGGKAEPELERLSNILKSFNDHFGTLFTDADRVRRYISEDIAPRVANDRAYQNARKNSGQQNARIEHDKALLRVMTGLLNDDTELFKQFQDNESFHRWLTDTVFAMTYDRKLEKQI